MSSQSRDQSSNSQSPRSTARPSTSAPPTAPRRKPLPQLPPLNDPYLFRTVFTQSRSTSNNNKSSSDLFSNDTPRNDDNATLRFRGAKFLDFAVCECLMVELTKQGVYDTTTLRLLHKMTLSTERLVKFSMRYGFDDDITRDGSSDFEAFDAGVYVDVFNAYVGGLLAEGAMKLDDIIEWVSGLVQHSFETDLKLVDEDQLKSFIMDDNTSFANVDDPVKFSKNTLYKILNPLKHSIDYKVLESSQPPESVLPYFKIGCFVDDNQLTIGEGQSKAKAGNNAAYSLLMKTKWRGQEDEITVETSLKKIIKELKERL